LKVRIVSENQQDQTYFGLHIWSRVLGHLAVLALALLLIPVSRNK
jgi:hypothetical protein